MQRRIIAGNRREFSYKILINKSKFFSNLYYSKNGSTPFEFEGIASENLNFIKQATESVYFYTPTLALKQHIHIDFSYLYCPLALLWWNIFIWIYWVQFCTPTMWSYLKALIKMQLFIVPIWGNQQITLDNYSELGFRAKEKQHFMHTSFNFMQSLA